MWISAIKGELMEGNIIAKRIQEDLKKAVKARNKLWISTLRMLLSVLKNAELDEREELTEEKEVAILASYARRCRESIEEFSRGGREDLVEKERAELDFVMHYLPEQLSIEEIEKEARRVIEETGAAGPRDMGRVMGAMMNKLKGRVDGGVVKERVSKLLEEI